MFGSIDKRPAFESYAARINARPAAQRAARSRRSRVKLVSYENRHRITWLADVGGAGQR
jgi:hypothetical protein